MSSKIGRNDLCPCGSGKKYKYCCGAKKNIDQKTNYFDLLLSEEKYLRKIDAVYLEIKELDYEKKSFTEIEKGIERFISKDNNICKADFNGFIEYAKDQYLPSPTSDSIDPRHMTWESIRSFRTPKIVLCLYLLIHYVVEIRELSKINSDESKDNNKLDTLVTKRELLQFFFDHTTNKENLAKLTIDYIVYDDLENHPEGYDQAELDVRTIKHHFYYSLQKGMRFDALKMLGRLCGKLDEAEYSYFNAMAYYRNENYLKSIWYLDKIAPQNKDYYPAAVALRLDCMTKLGDVRGFLECLRCNNRFEYDPSQIIYYFMFLYLMPIDEKDNGIEELYSNEINEIFSNIRLMEEMNTNTIYYVRLLSLVADTVVEGFSILDENEEMHQLYDDYELPEDLGIRLGQIKLALMVFNSSFRYSFDCYFSTGYYKNRDYKSIKNEASKKLVKLLIQGNHDEKLVVKAILAQYKLGLVDECIGNTMENIDFLIHSNEADELLYLVYLESEIRGSVDDRLKEYINHKISADIEEDIEYKRIMDSLSVQGKKAYESAEWTFKKSQEEDYGWKDAGMISVGYYRILEVELNQKIMIPLLKQIGYEKIDKTFQEVISGISNSKKRDTFKNKWEKNLGTFKELEENEYKGPAFMLGPLDFFFKTMCNSYKNNNTVDALTQLMLDNISDLLNENGMEKLKMGFFDNITDKKVRDKYRNPPAHTEYLKYEVACQCRDAVKENLIQLFSFLK